MADTTASIDAVIGCITALREAEAHIRATALDFSGGERLHHMQAAEKAKRALDALAFARSGQAAAAKRECL